MGVFGRRSFGAGANRFSQGAPFRFGLLLGRFGSSLMHVDAGPGVVSTTLFAATCSNFQGWHDKPSCGFRLIGNRPAYHQGMILIVARFLSS